MGGSSFLIHRKKATKKMVCLQMIILREETQGAFQDQHLFSWELLS